MHEQWDDYTAKIRECDSKLEDIRREPNEDAAEDDMDLAGATARMPRDEATTKMRDIAGHLVKALEAVSGNERAKNLLNTLSAQLGELEGTLKPAADRGERSKKGAQEPSAWGETWPRVGNQMEQGKGRGEGKGERPAEYIGDTKGGGKGCAGEIDRSDQNAQHKWARRGARRGRGESEAQDGAGQHGGDGAMEDAGSSPKAEAASKAAEAADWEAKRQRALDRIRARLQQEKNRKAAEVQAKAIAEGVMAEPHLLSKEQLEENQRRVEATNREVDEEAERELASMSKDQLARIMEEDWAW